MSGDPIVALATPPGVGAVAVFRISGEGSGERLRPLFPGRDIHTIPPRTLTLRRLVHPGTGEELDQVLLVRFPAPHSYTGEEMWEVHTHGGWWLTRRLLDLFLQQGFREAKPGEFTYRAVLHGKMDLLQAQAVNELVHAGSDEGIRLALARLRGDTSDTLRRFRDRLLRTWMEMEARLDFPEEVPTLEEPALMAQLQELAEEIGRMVEEGERGQRWMGGHRLVILGPPNAGKSTLFNRMVGEERAIVTPIPGTTRDVLRERVIWRGIPLILLDTAGIRVSGDPVEQEGLRRARRALQHAHLLFWVAVPTEPWEEAWRVVQTWGDLPDVVWIWNKQDLWSGPPPEPPVPTRVAISARTGTGMDLLERVLRQKIQQGKAPRMAWSERDARWLRRARQHLLDATGWMREGAPLEVAAHSVREAVRELAVLLEIEDMEETLLDELFSTFCIGK